jgi:hypothetical protein
MTDTQTILQTIEARIVEANSEIASLTAARTALASNGAATPATRPNP